MARWIGEWMMVSMLFVLGAGVLFLLWAVWPLLPQRLPVEVLASLRADGILAIVMLVVVVGGFGKLMAGR